MSKKSEEEEIARQRDEVIKRMFATPPKPHKDEPKRRKTPAPETRQLKKNRVNRPWEKLGE